MTRYAVRPAVEADAQVLLAWHNDTQTLRWARNQEEVAWPGHVRWLRSTVAADDRLLWVVEADDRQVASVRYDRDDADPTTVEVSIVVAGEARGQGVGAEALRRGEEELGTCWPDVRTIAAVVHCDNAASRRLFHRAGYHVQVEADPWVTLTKTIDDEGTAVRPSAPEELPHPT